VIETKLRREDQEITPKASCLNTYRRRFKPMPLALVEDPALVLISAGGLDNDGLTTIGAGNAWDEGAAAAQSRAG